MVTVVAYCDRKALEMSVAAVLKQPLSTLAGVEWRSQFESDQQRVQSDEAMARAVIAGVLAVVPADRLRSARVRHELGVHRYTRLLALLDEDCAVAA